MISIVIPAFNEEELLPECLRSLKTQDYTGDYEIIVVDNASTDNTSKIASEHGTKVVFCATRGVVYARQAGASVASGEIIVQVDADTIYPPDWLIRIAAHFSTHSSAALAGTYIYSDPQPSWAKAEYFLRYLGNRIGLVLFRRPVCISGANFAFRQEAFRKANGYEPRSLYPDQWGISRRLSKAGKVAYDRDLTVSTCTRRIQNPLYIIILQIVRNIIKLSIHCLRHIGRVTWSFIAGSPPVRNLARIIVKALVTVTARAVLLWGKVFYRNGMAKEKRVALTFDDGPNEPYTSRILDILDRYKAKATFFVIGQNVEFYPDTTRRILAEGHVLGNHSYSHEANHVSAENRARDFRRAQNIISEATGVIPHLCRPAQDRKLLWKLVNARKVGLFEVAWDASTDEAYHELVLDKSLPEAEGREVSEAEAGQVILLHDGHGTDHDVTASDKSLTVEVLPVIIEELQKQGYRFVTVPALLKVPAYND
ncbi:MAG: glycosyltransferase [Chloroflexota bacterium]